MLISKLFLNVQGFRGNYYCGDIKIYTFKDNEKVYETTIEVDVNGAWPGGSDGKGVYEIMMIYTPKILLEFDNYEKTITLDLSYYRAEYYFRMIRNSNHEIDMVEYTDD